MKKFLATIGIALMALSIAFAPAPVAEDLVGSDLVIGAAYYDLCGDYVPAGHNLRGGMPPLPLIDPETGNAVRDADRVDEGIEYAKSNYFYPSWCG